MIGVGPALLRMAP